MKTKIIEFLPWKTKIKDLADSIERFFNIEMLALIARDQLEILLRVSEIEYFNDEKFSDSVIAPLAIAAAVTVAIVIKCFLF